MKISVKRLPPSKFFRFLRFFLRSLRVSGFLVLIFRRQPTESLRPEACYPNNVSCVSRQAGKFRRSSCKRTLMISVSNVSMRYGAKVLFEDVSTAFTPGKRYGLTGPNGAGKTTFMNLLSGELEPQKGTVVRPRKLSLLSQNQFAYDAYRFVDTGIS